MKEEEKKAVVVGEKEVCSEKAASTSELPCMDRLREELSCAVRGICCFILFRLIFCSRIVDLTFLESKLCVGFFFSFFADMFGDLLRAEHHAVRAQVILYCTVYSKRKWLKFSKKKYHETKHS